MNKHYEEDGRYTEKEAIVLRLKRLFPDEEYNEEEIIL